MAYTPTVWATGDEITEEKLNKIENGIVESFGTGLPTGGKTRQVLVKKNDSNYQATWSTLTASEVGAVSKSGDTVNGNLTIAKTNGVGLFLNELSNMDAGQFVIQAAGVALISATLSGIMHGISFRNSGGETHYLRYHLGDSYYPILHTRNKPSNYYIGDGNETPEILCTSSIGIIAAICGGGKFVIAYESGGICSDGTTLSPEQIKFLDGQLIVSTNDDRVNKSGTKYFWTIL